MVWYVHWEEEEDDDDVTGTRCSPEMMHLPVERWPLITSMEEGCGNYTTKTTTATTVCWS